MSGKPELPACPFCRRPVRVLRSYAGSGSYQVACTNPKCDTRWPKAERRYIAVDEFLGYRSLHER